MALGIGKLNPQYPQKDPDAYWEIHIGYMINWAIIQSYPEIPGSGFPVILKIHDFEYEAALHAFHDQKRYSYSYIGKPVDKDRYYMQIILSAVGLFIVNARIELDFDGSIVKLLRFKAGMTSPWIKI